MKKCSKCQKETDNFRPDLHRKDGLYDWCRDCVNEYQKNWRNKNSDRTSRYARKGQLRRRYSTTIEEYDKMLLEQKGVCAICGGKDPLDHAKYFHIDHNHKTGEIRGLLCGLCNKGLGCFKDDTVLLNNAINFLEKEKKMEKPKILKRLVKQLEDKGMDAGRANATAISALRKSGNLKKGSLEPTKKGIARGNMTPSERAKDRAAKESGRPKSDYKYDAKTNKATLKKKK